MNLLLDTHTFLWHANGDPQMSTAATHHLTDATNELFLSIASIWEIAIKVGLGKLVLSNSYNDFMIQAVTGYNLKIIPISQEDCAIYEQLGFPNLQHRDPFDRMIAVHATRNGLTLVGIDHAFDHYGVPRIW